MSNTDPGRTDGGFSPPLRSDVATVVELVDIAEIGPRLEAKLNGDPK